MTDEVAGMMACVKGEGRRGGVLEYVGSDEFVS